MNFEARPRVEARPLKDIFGAEIAGVDIAKPVAPESFKAIRDIWLQYPVIVFRKVEWTPEAQIAFSKHFGEIEEIYLQYATLPGYPEIFVISNIPDKQGKVHVPRVGRHWHTDSQFLKNPVSATMLYGKAVPPVGGDTEFINMYDVYEALPQAMKTRVQGLKIVYDRAKHQALEHPDWPPITEEEKRRMPPIAHPIVRAHVETGRKALYISAMQGLVIEGWTEEASQAFIKELLDFADQPKFVRNYHWEPGDVVVWDNRCLLHRSTSFDMNKYSRHMLRTAIVGDVPQ